MQRWILVVLLLPVCLAEEGPPPMAMMAQRLMASLPNIPNVIQGQMEGSTDELKKMVSSVLGDGLISQLVVNPVGVAEEMGMSMDSLGINKTDMIAKLNNATNGLAGSFLEQKTAPGLNNKTSIFGDLPNLFTTTEPTTTTTVMYMDGVPIQNFDDFIRKHNPIDARGRPLFSTQAAPPTTTTTPLPSAQEIAETVLEALKKNGVAPGSTTPLPAQPPAESIAPSFDLDPSTIDPMRLGEVNHLLRRAPQHFDTLSAPPSPLVPVVPLDPQIDSVLTTLRTKSFSGLTVEEVKKLQGALQQYEQSLQTKELFTKRKQLEILQNELVEQKKRIEEQKRMEEALRKKEKELEEKRLEMELQLQKQLNSWHSSFNSHPPGIEMPTLSSIGLPSGNDVEMAEVPLPSPPEVAPPTDLPSPTAETPMAFPPGAAPPNFMFNSAPTFSMKPSSVAAPRVEEPLEQLDEPAPSAAPVKSPLSQLRYSPEDSQAQMFFDEDPHEDQHEGEFSSACECIEVSLEKMTGSWVPALSSSKAQKKTESSIGMLIASGSENRLSCSRYDFSAPKTSQAAQEARVTWEFRTQGSRRRYKFTGSALSIDHITTRVQLQDVKGSRVAMPFCVLKTGGDTTYDYMVMVNASGPCNEATLLVRDPNTFFDSENHGLVKFLKHRISQGDMDQMDIVPYADDCRS